MFRMGCSLHNLWGFLNFLEEAMSAKRHRRLGKDIQEIIRTADPQIHIHLVDGSTHDVKALLIPLSVSQILLSFRLHTLAACLSSR
jgi:hypothetical protein